MTGAFLEVALALEVAAPYMGLAALEVAIALAAPYMALAGLPVVVGQIVFALVLEPAFSSGPGPSRTRTWRSVRQPELLG